MRFTPTLLALACATTAFAAISPAHAAKNGVQVGHCLLKLPSYGTISDAITHAPAGGTISVCPGSYAEQLTISKNLTIQAVDTGTKNGATGSSLVQITLPGGFAPNASDLDGGGPIVAQAVVTAGNVNLIGLTFDASAASGMFSDCSTDLVGVLFQNASGSVQNSAILNDSLGGGQTGCQQGLGLYVQAGNGGQALVNASGTYVEGFQKGGIIANDTGVVLGANGNFVLGAGPRSDNAEDGIQVAFGAAGSVIGNLLGYNDYTGADFLASAVLFYDPARSQANGNTVQDSQYGVAIANDAASSLPPQFAQNNTIADAYDGVDLFGAIASATVSDNLIFGASNSAVHLESPQNGAGNVTATVTSNTFNSACSGIIDGSGATLKSSSNTFLNVGTDILAGTDTCGGGDFAHAPQRRTVSVRR